MTTAKQIAALEKQIREFWAAHKVGESTALVDDDLMPRLRALRASLPAALSLQPGIAHSGKGRQRRPFMVER